MDSCSTCSTITVSPEIYKYLFLIKRDELCDEHPEAEIHFVSRDNSIRVTAAENNTIRHFIDEISTEILSKRYYLGTNSKLICHLKESNFLVGYVNDLLKEKSIPVCLYFCSKLSTFLFVYSKCDDGVVRDASRLLNRELKESKCSIPKLLSPCSVLKSIPAFEPLKNEIDQQYGEKIRLHFCNGKVVVTGLAKEVNIVYKKLKDFFNEIVKTLQPKTLHVGQIVASALKTSPNDLKDSISMLKVSVDIEKKKRGILVTPFSYMEETWQEESQDKLKAYIQDNIQESDPIPILECAASEVEEMVKNKMSSKNYLPLAYNVEPDSIHPNHVMFRFAGKTNSVEMVVKDALSINYDLSDTSEIFEFEEKTFIYLSQVKEKELRQDHPNLQFRFNQRDFTLHVEGKRREINKLGRELKFISVYEESSNDYPILPLLTGPDKKDFMNTYLKNQGCPQFTVFLSASSELFLLCEPGKNAQLHKILSKLQCKNFEVPSSMNMDSIKVRFSNIKVFISFNSPDSRTLVLVGLPRDLTNVQQRLHDFVSENCDVTVTLSFEATKIDTVKKCMPSKMNIFLEECKGKSVKIELNNQDFALSGEKGNVSELKKKLEEIFDSVYEESCEFSTSREIKFLQDENTQKTMKVLESDHNVHINTSTENLSYTVPERVLSQSSISPSSEFDVTDIPINERIALHQGNLLDIKV